MAAQPPVSPNLELFGKMFVTLAQAINQAIAGEAQDLTPLQLMILLHVYTHAGTRMSALASAAGVTRPQLSRTMHDLEKKALVQRQHNAQNRRVVNVYPTAAGTALAERQMQDIQTRLSARLSGLDPLDRDQLDANLATAIQILSKVGIVPPLRPDDPCQAGLGFHHPTK